MIKNNQRVCPHCCGNGEIKYEDKRFPDKVRHEDPCTLCKGEKSVERKISAAYAKGELELTNMHVEVSTP